MAAAGAGAAAAAAADRIIDMLANFRFVGAIHLSLPNARIIHVRRNPVDTRLSRQRLPLCACRAPLSPHRFA